jgi:LuxR family maltose regulon positive regulatory protein
MFKQAADRSDGMTTSPARPRGEDTQGAVGRGIASDLATADRAERQTEGLDRGHLRQMLDRAVTKRLTVISAPAGSGKTSLLRAWAERSDNPHRVAFVSVDREQQDARRFLGGVLAAIRLLASPGELETAAETDGLDGDELVDAVVSDVAEQGEAVVLIIDDLHELRSAEALAQLDRLLATLPSSAHVVLSSRRDLPMRLHRLRLADEIAEIRAADLRFTLRETLELLAASGVSLSDAAAAALYERTEGWVAGLRLAVVALSDHPDPERFVAEFSGTDRAIGEYLIAEMLERQPSEVQSLLLRTSLVDRLSGELADVLAGRQGSEQILLELEDANAFVVSLDAERTWFRYHQLLSDFLRLELRRTFAGEVPELHRRAARWFADRGDVVEAVRHTVAAGDWPDAARLLADYSFSLTLDGREGEIGALLRLFPEGATVDHPDLALARAATDLADGRLEDAAAQLALAATHVQSTPPARQRRLTVAIASLRLALARRSGQFTEVIEQVNLLDASIADEPNEPIAMSTELRGVALMNLGIVETWSGRLVDAERHLSEGAVLAQSIGRPYLEVACRAHQGFPSRDVSVAKARERGEQAVSLAEHYGLGDRPVLAPAFAATGGMAIWMGEFDEAEHWLRRAWDVAEPRVEPAPAVLLHVAMGMLHLGRAEHGRALEEFAAAERSQSLLTGAHTLAPRITSWLAMAQARVGMTDEARATLSRFSSEPGRRGVLNNAIAVVALEDGDPAAALEELRDVAANTPVIGPAFTLVETHLLTGIAHLSLGDRTAAAAAAEAALAAAEPDRLIYSFLALGAAELLDTLPHHETAHGALLADIVDLLHGESTASPTRQGLSEPDELSPSELRVLRYLPTNLTRPEIAGELYLSTNTVNSHIKSIYSKLGAGDRSSAVQIARELRLLSPGRLRRAPK